MTKDRRLGRGLAALLGTPLDQDNSMAIPIDAAGQGVDSNSTAPSPMQFEAKASTTGTSSHGKGDSLDPVSRSEMIRALNGEAHKNLDSVETSGRAVVELPVSKIDNNPFQPRREFNDDEIAALAASLKEHEQLQPILVRRVGDRYQLISGERRLRASIRAGFTKIRAEIRVADDRQVAELAIVENLQRKDLNPVEKAMSFKRYLSQHKCTQDELAKRLKIDRSTIANLMRMLELPDPILEAIQKEEISAGHARALLPLGDESQQLRFANQIKADCWSVRETERRVAETLSKEDDTEQGIGGPASDLPPKRTKSEQLVSIERELKASLGTKVEIRQTAKGRGKIVISFSNQAEFDRIRNAFAETSGTNGFRAAA